MNNSSSSSITALVPGGVVTTQNISTVIKPKENNNSMQFVKIQTPELSKKAVEQIRVAQESKITKDKIKEVEEEWQSNLLNWKSKRRQQFVGVHPNDGGEQDGEQNNNNNNHTNENGRKIKTFAEMIEQRAKTGNRLNFHLERYIGSSESDNYDEEQGDIDNDEDDVDEHDDRDNDKKRCQIVDEELKNSHSIQQININNYNNNSISNGNNISSSQYEKPPLVVEGDDNKNNSSVRHPLSNGDCDTTDNSNNSLVGPNHFVCQDEVDRADDGAGGNRDAQERQPINSTFIQGIDQPPTPPTIYSDDRIRPLLDVDTTTKEVSSAARPFEDNGSDHEDEEDEQEEEQKHLQRIAFVEKLKAFEKMTKPSLPEPRFVPTRTVKAPPAPPPAPSRSSNRSASQSRLPSVTNATTPTQPSKSRPQPQPPIQMEPSSQQHHYLPSPILPPSQPHPRAHHKIPSPQPQPQQQPQAQQPQAELPPQHTQHQHRPQQQRISPPPPPVVSAPQMLHETPPAQPVRKQLSIPEVPTRDATPRSPPRSPPKQHQQSTPPLPPPIISPALSSKLSTASLPPESPSLSPSPQRQQHPQKQQQQQQQAPTRQQSQQQPQLQQQQPSLKDDKSQDRTVLSVSGKKRCSSCKEELGRGAAAFVIESLNLVYHTNCFRCSVCHVNLSNGFRGVDVRVHAGALHCQNCYSKDGLNYSRV